MEKAERVSLLGEARTLINLMIGEAGLILSSDTYKKADELLNKIRESLG